MEKLIELLNEYEKGIKKSEFYEWEKWIWWPNNLFRRDTRDEEWSHLYSDTADTYVISKKYGFIWWLVENEKIELEAWPLYWCQLIMHNRQPYTLYETILMLLAIEENPIDLLCSILK